MQVRTTFIAMRDNVWITLLELFNGRYFIKDVTLEEIDKTEALKLIEASRSL